MSLDMFFQHFFNALTLGSLYGLIAIGYTPCQLNLPFHLMLYRFLNNRK